MILRVEWNEPMIPGDIADNEVYVKGGGGTLRMEEIAYKSSDGMGFLQLIVAKCFLGREYYLIYHKHFVAFHSCFVPSEMKEAQENEHWIEDIEWTFFENRILEPPLLPPVLMAAEVSRIIFICPREISHSFTFSFRLTDIWLYIFN